MTAPIRFTVDGNPIGRAVVTLFPNAWVRGGQAWLRPSAAVAARPVTLAALVRAANAALIAQGRPGIAYPGVAAATGARR